MFSKSSTETMNDISFTLHLKRHPFSWMFGSGALEPQTSADVSCQEFSLLSEVNSCSVLSRRISRLKILYFARHLRE